MDPELLALLDGCRDGLRSLSDDLTGVVLPEAADEACLAALRQHLQRLLAAMTLEPR